MTSPNKPGAADTRAPSEDVIEDYLGKHPEFFQGRDELLTRITLPHGAGAAVSLIERQVALLREQNHNYRRQLQNLMQIGRANDELICRLQQLTLRLLDSTGIEDILDLIERSLRQDFHAEAATLALFGDFPESDRGIRAREFIRIEVVTDITGCRELRKLIALDQPVCGMLDRDCLTALFGNRADAIASTAVVPLTAAGAAARPVGLLAIGSESEERFNPEMGTTYLRHLGDLLGHRLGPCLVPSSG
jgi:uncharacterized protein